MNLNVVLTYRRYRYIMYVCHESLLGTAIDSWSGLRCLRSVPCSVCGEGGLLAAILHNT